MTYSPSGGLNVLKPPGLTSHDVVSRMRRLLKIKKIGHAGTLDPAAAGVLPICVGEATKTIQFIQDCKKTYRAELILGSDTDTLDYTGNILKQAPSDTSVSAEVFGSTLSRFTGRISQIPPMVSALKKDGVRLYDLARQGIEIEREPREIEIHKLEIVGFNKKFLNNQELPNLKMGDAVIIDITCSKGTYVRTLCADVGAMLGCGAHMGFLLRTKVGSMDVGSSLTLEELENLGQTRAVECLIPITELLKELPRLSLEGAIAAKAKNGMKLSVPRAGYNVDFNDDRLYFLTEADEPIAIYRCIRIDNDNAFIEPLRGFRSGG